MGPVTFLFLLFNIVLHITMARSTFDPTRVHFIDRKTVSSSISNYLFRGNLPLNSNHTFALSDLNATLQDVAIKEGGFELPSNYFLVIVSLLDPLELKDAIVEIDFLKAHPSIGEYVHWPLVGSVIPPDSVPEFKRRDLAMSLSNWSLDKLPEKMITLSENLKLVHSQPFVYYIHCEAGMDRTGELSGSYYMYALNETFANALNYDNHVENRTISIESQNELQWYCYNLKYLKDTDRNCSL